ncbi:M23 family metallopeptidase [Desulfovibrio cuneatus]|uniref:M23 family metallopeptidase n=1 Tax=Desulfovibrio cuneatus TaxID=159728 RepID=UPI0006865198|nr:M23 family metallopeptidase [Desulfovibrio cuneatus]
MVNSRLVFCSLLALLVLPGCVKKQPPAQPAQRTEPAPGYLAKGTSGKPLYIASQNSLQNAKFLVASPVKHGEVCSLFGPRKLSAKRKATKFHWGIDIRAKRGTEVLAAAPGKVVFVGKGQRGYGKTVDIEHQNGFVTRYAHLDRFYIKNGAVVQEGTLIGTVGRSGRTTGANLHFEVLKNGQRLNPLEYKAWVE